jgi:DNA-binding transcriptional regulator YiaG
MSFELIEALLGAALPDSARQRRDWWGNRKNALQAGYHAVQIDLAGESVVFRKPTREVHVRRQGSTVLWNGEMIKALRQHMDLSQSQFADQLGVRQQTVSEWETGAYEPRRATCKYLTLVAEVSELYVKHSRRDGEVEHALLHHIECLAKECGAQNITLLTGLKNEAAQELYRSLGYRDHALAMRKHLGRAD